MIENKGKFIIFGGILEITKESDEAFQYDLATNTWSVLDSTSWDALGNSSNTNHNHTDSASLDLIHSISKKESSKRLK